MNKNFYWLCLAFLISGCNSNNQHKMTRTFKEDLDFLKKHVPTIVLTDGKEGRLAVVPGYQGRVMTSTLNGDEGTSFGWVNRDLIGSGQTLANFNPYGGEDRFWLGPEGGQFSLFHKPGGPFTLDNWVVPKPIDTMPFQLKEQTDSTAAFEAHLTVTNYSGTQFRINVNRTIKMLTPEEDAGLLGLDNIGNLKIVGFESENHIVNAGDSSWRKDKGLVSVWVLGMFSPSNNVTIIIPFFQGGEGALGPVVNDKYFGKVPPDRLKISGGVILFSGDGKYRSKIGLNWERAKDVLGSYD